MEPELSCNNRFSIFISHLLHTEDLTPSDRFDLINHIYRKIKDIKTYNTTDKSEDYAIFEEFLKVRHTRPAGKYFATGGANPTEEELKNRIRNIITSNFLKENGKFNNDYKGVAKSYKKQYGKIPKSLKPLLQNLVVKVVKEVNKLAKQKPPTPPTPMSSPKAEPEAKIDIDEGNDEEQVYDSDITDEDLREQLESMLDGVDLKNAKISQVYKQYQTTYRLGGKMSRPFRKRFKEIFEFIKKMQLKPTPKAAAAKPKSKSEPKPTSEESKPELKPEFESKSKSKHYSESESDSQDNDSESEDSETSESEYSEENEQEDESHTGTSQLDFFRNFLETYGSLTPDNMESLKALFITYYTENNEISTYQQEFENETHFNVFTVLCKTTIYIDETSIYRDSANGLEYYQVKVLFPEELFGAPRTRRQNTQKYMSIILAISAILDNTVYPLGSNNTIYCQTGHVLNADSSMQRMNLGEYVLNNRKEFVPFMRTTFLPAFQKFTRPYMKQWIDTSGETDGAYEVWQLFQQQRYVSEFLNDNTPYRGLLYYHGLGSGKSGASIATTEGFHNRRVVILLPASLRENYRGEISRFSNISYKYQHKWCYVPLDIKGFPANVDGENSALLEQNEEIIKALVEKGIPRELLDYRSAESPSKKENNIMNKVNCPNTRTIIRIRPKHKNISVGNVKNKKKKTYDYGIWLIDPTSQTPNFEQLSVQDRLEVNDTIQKMWHHRYKMIGYNSGATLFTHSNFGIFSLYPPELFERIMDQALGMRVAPSKLTNRYKGMIFNTIYNPEYGFPNPFDNTVVVIDEVHNLVKNMINAGYNGANLYEMLMRAKNCKIIALSGTPIVNHPIELIVLTNLLRGMESSITFTVENEFGQKITANNSQGLIDTLNDIPEIDRISTQINNTYTITQLPYMFIRSKEVGEKWDGKVKKLESKNEFYGFLEEKMRDIHYTTSDTYISTLDIASNVFIDYVSNKLADKRLTINRKSIKSGFHSSFPDILLKTSEEFAEGIVAYGHYRMLRRTHKEFLKNGEKIAKHLSEIFNINPETGDIVNEYAFLSRILGLISYYCETVSNVPLREYVYEGGRKVDVSDISVFPRVIINEPLEIKLSEYQLYEYVPYRKYEIYKEEMIKKDLREEGADKDDTQIFRVFTRQISRFAFPPGVPRPRMDYSRIGKPILKQKEKETGAGDEEEQSEPEGLPPGTDDEKDKEDGNKDKLEDVQSGGALSKICEQVESQLLEPNVNFQRIKCPEDEKALKTCYLALSKKYHPDKHTNKPQEVQDRYTEIFQKLNNWFNRCENKDQFDDDDADFDGDGGTEFREGEAEERRPDREGGAGGGDGSSSYEEVGKITEKHLKQEYEANILKALDKLTPRNLKPRAPGDLDMSSPTLTECSPIYEAMLESVNGSPGLIFGYSQFRKVEGVELFKRVLEANGWASYHTATSGVVSQQIHQHLATMEIKIGMMCVIQLGMHLTVTSKCTNIEKNAKGYNRYFFADFKRDFDNAYRFHIDDWGDSESVKREIRARIITHCEVKNPDLSFPDNISEVATYGFKRKYVDQARFGLWTGQEDTEQRKELQAIYNSLENRLGRFCKMMMTTSAGSEGISLRHVRDVHIMEPYWNRVRVEQVIGRARRVKSHLELVPEQHNVRVHEYVTIFDKDLLKKAKEADGVDERGNRKKLDDPELFVKKRESTLKHATRDEFQLPSYSEFLEDFAGLFGPPDNGLTTDSMLYQDGMRKFRINKLFLDKSRNVAIDCQNNAEHNIQAGKLKEGDNYTEIECISDGEYSDEYDPERIRTARKEQDKYAYPLNLSGEEYAANRNKKFKKVEKQTGLSLELPIRNIPSVSTFWRISKSKIAVGIERLDAKVLYNLYAYIGVDPMFESFKQPSMHFNPKTIDKCKIGKYNNNDPTKFHLKSSNIDISDEHILYLHLLHNYIQSAWEHLKTEGYVEGRFMPNNKDAMTQIRTLIIQETKSNLPFTFEFKGKKYAFGSKTFYGKVNLNDKSDKSILMKFLKMEVTKMKLAYRNKVTEMKQLRDGGEPQKPKATTKKAKQPKVAAKPKKKVKQTKSAIKEQISKIPKPKPKGGRRRRRRGED